MSYSVSARWTERHGQVPATCRVVTRVLRIRTRRLRIWASAMQADPTRRSPQSGLPATLPGHQAGSPSPPTGVQRVERRLSLIERRKLTSTPSPELSEREVLLL